MSRLSRKERETILLFNEQDETALVDVSNRRLRRRLDTLAAERPARQTTGRGGRTRPFRIPKTWIRINPLVG